MSIDWTEEERIYFGFINVWTPNWSYDPVTKESCKTDKEKDLELFKYRFGLNFTVEHEFGL